MMSGTAAGDAIIAHAFVGNLHCRRTGKSQPEWA